MQCFEKRESENIKEKRKIYAARDFCDKYDFVPFGIELVFHTENSMKYRSLHTILKYRFNIPFRYEIPIFCT